ncbi:hypothetical protein, partial [Ralstonia solanacearum]|uniref:hypothetical protein n=1 Tax=Ralstonia solanacearum TaxID=305 RepID=UPI0019D39899
HKRERTNYRKPEKYLEKKKGGRPSCSRENTKTSLEFFGEGAISGRQTPPPTNWQNVPGITNKKPGFVEKLGNFFQVSKLGIPGILGQLGRKGRFDTGPR